MVRLRRRWGRRGAGMGLGCAVMLAGSRARRGALWACSRDGPSARCPWRRQTSLGAIDASASSCARCFIAHWMTLASRGVSVA